MTSYIQAVYYFFSSSSCISFNIKKSDIFDKYFLPKKKIIIKINEKIN